MPAQKLLEIAEQLQITDGVARARKQDIIFAGGCEELDWTLSVLFDAMGALSSKYNDSPEKASRPYDTTRDGFVIAGGGGVVVLEELEHASRPAQQALNLVQNALPDLILPVPLYRWRLWWRGFNQAAVIARHVGQRLRVPVHTRGIGHSGARVHQVGLDARARRRAVRGAFDVRLDLRDRHVALVDDVMTTGATLHELAQAVRAAGASRVEAWVLARTPKSGRG